MGKKITSIIVIAVALLLALPTQAQVPAERSKVSGASHKMHELKGAKKKAKEISALREKNQKEAAPVASSVGNVSRVMPSVVPVRAKANGKPRKAETVDKYGVITEPAEGEHKLYARSGSAITVSNQSVSKTTQSGKIEIVETEDGVVYFKDFFSIVPVETWIKGTREGNTITVPANQVIVYWEDDGYGVRTGYVSYDSTNGFAEVNAGEPYILTVDEEANTITLEGTGDYLNDNYYGAGLFYTDDNNFTGYSDFSSVFTYYPPVVVDELPYVNNFETGALQNQLEIIDANADGKTWSFDSSTGNTIAFYRYSSTNQGDDYLVSPAIKLEAGKNYLVTINANARSASYPERFEVVAGKEATAAALTIPVIAATDVANAEAEDYEGTFSVAETGYYHVAIHAISDADKYFLMVNSISIDKGAEAAAPAAITDLNVTPAAEGTLEATVNFTAPAKAYNGTNLTGNITKVEVYRNNVLVKEIENIAPGSKQSWTDTSIEEPGIYTYQVVAYNASGNGPKSEKASTYVGVDTPEPVENFFAADQGTAVKFSWDAVSTGENGGYVNPAQVEYLLWTVGWESFMGYSFPVLDEKIDSVFATSYILDNVNLDEGEQTYEYWGIEPRTSAGTGSYNLATLLVGAPYELPVTEGFTGSTMHYIWEDVNLGLSVSNDASDEDGVALNIKLDKDAEGTDGYFVSGKLDLRSAAKPTLVFDLKTDAADALFITGSKDGGQFVMLQEDITASASEYTTVKVPLNAIVGERYSRLSFDFDFSENLDASFLIDNIRIVDLYAYDLAANVKTAKSLTLGEHTNVVVTVENKGENAAENYTVILKAGNKEVFKQKVSEALAPFKSREFRVDYAPSVFDKAGDTNITAEVVFESDQNKSNNIATTSITLIAPVAPTPENLQVAQANGKVTMTWEAPDTETEEEPEEMTENFDDAETFPEFSTGGVDENTHTGMLGDWMVYDGNGGAAGYGFQGIDVPNMGDGNAWMVFTPSSSQLAQDLSANYAPHSGTQCLLSACVAEPEGNPAATDHWLISPQLPGTAQTISFWVRELVTTYGAEKFEIWTSKTNTDIGSFSLLKSASTSSDAWEEVSFSLPAGTKYFAIRHTSTDVWALLVDDITFTAGGVSFGEVTSYNVYIDGEYDDVSEETSYEYDEDVVDGYHIFAVTAVYDDGTESMPATAALKVVTDGIESIMAQGKPVHVYTVNGQYLGKVITLKGMKKGVYVINNKKVVLK